MEEKLIKITEKSINKIIQEGITTGNLEYLDKLVDIYKDTKEVQNMYGNYGRNYYGEYGRGNYADSYGRRGYDAKYRGEDKLEEMHGYYRDYSDGRERYGANEDTKRSLEYMLRSMEDFARMLKEEAKSQEEVQMIKETAQRIAQM